MNILVLGLTPSRITPILEEYGCSVIERAGQVNVELLRARAIEFAVSYRYRHIIKKSIIEYLQGRLINLHISLLPWNRGADPNLWSFLEDTPKGVTIHEIDEGIDTGDIIAQKEVAFSPVGETLKTTYEKLDDEIIELFKEQWPRIINGTAPRNVQPPGGSMYRIEDKNKFIYLLAEQGWDTPVSKIIGKALGNSRK